ncbi:MAG: single-stranded DNA-binding protein, partial [Alphaproteobacteria bacterium]|nr:single-stranded DNA-binding protein [Alphaproteobacteria bacterium]
MTNLVLLVGNLGADPESRSTSGGTDVTTISVGTSRPKRDSEGKTYKDASGFTAKDTEWHRVTCFNGLGRIIEQHATKGMLVSVRGRIH